MKMNKDRIIGLILIVFSSIFIYLTYAMDIEAGSMGSTPRTFPYIACFTIFICGVLIFLRGKEEEKPVLTRDGIYRVIRIISMIILFPIGLKTIGYMFTTPIIIFLFVGLFESKAKLHIRSKLIYTVMLAIFLNVLFGVILDINLPVGMLGELL